LAAIGLYRKKLAIENAGDSFPI